MGRLCTLSLQTSLLQTSGTKHLHLPCSSWHRGQECTGEICRAHSPGCTPCPAQGYGRATWLLSLSHFRCLSQLGGHRDAVTLPCSLPGLRRGAAASTACSVCCRWIAQLWGSGKQLLPHTCQQGELSRDLLCCKGLGAAAWPSTLQGSSQGCSSALLGGAGQCEPAQVSELAVPHRMSPRLCPACGRQGR